MTLVEAAKQREETRIVDDFDGQLKLDWQLLRPDPTHISLSKQPGSLTISTQKGTIHLKGKPKARNILLLDNPLPEGTGFVVTTCLDGFYPREPYQQAGLIVYNDDDNYLKWVIEQTTRGGIPDRVAWNFLRETNGRSTMDKPDITHDMTKKVWLRLTLRKDRYEYASSTDGKEWTVHGEAPWGDGPPDRIGLLAKAAWARETSSIDACFDFFEIRPLTETKAPDAPSRREQALGSEAQAPVSKEMRERRDSVERRTVLYQVNAREKEAVLTMLRTAQDHGVMVKETSKDSLAVQAHPRVHVAIHETLARLKRTLPQPAMTPGFRLYDGFDGEFALDWKPVRPDPAHVSLTKNPGKLTITTQRGGIYGSVGPSAKNFYLIRNPLAEDGDFVLTTCIESFKPTLSWQQAGLLVYDDDDNYLKCDVEWSKSAVQFRYIRETDGQPVNKMDQTDVDQEHVWIRIIKRGKSYERLYSSDGNNFVSAGAGDWGDGSPKWLGIVAKNGPNITDEIDAVFDFFEFRSLTPAEKERPSVAEPVPAPQAKPEEKNQDDVKKDGGPLMPEKGVQVLPLAEWCILETFDKEVAGTWKPVRPDPTHVSFTKNPGKLTITTQCGSICGDETNRAAKTPAKNLYLTPSPDSGLNFAILTCIESFKPTVPYQQAGLIVYDDDDNFVKGVFEHDLGGLVLNSAWETDQEVEYQRHRLQSYPERLWLCIVKRGRHYEFSYSEGGKQFTVAGQGEWGTGEPKWIGLIATNGNVSDAADMPRSHRFPSTPIDAVFDSFEVRSLTAAEKAAVSEKRTYSSRPRAPLVSGSAQRLPEAYVSPSPKSNAEMRLSIAGRVVVLQWVDGNIVVSEILASIEPADRDYPAATSTQREEHRSVMCIQEYALCCERPRARAGWYRLC